MRSTDDRILDFVRFGGEVDRATIADALAMPAATIASAVKRLLDAGQLVSVGAEQGRPTRGRGRHLVRIAGPTALVGVITWESEQVTASLVDSQGRMLRREPVTPEVTDTTERLLGWAAEVPEAELDTVVVSLSAPSPHPSGQARATDSPAEFGFDPDLDPVALQQRFGVRFLVENDANLAALGEQHAAIPRRESFVYLKLYGHGVGSAVVINGQLVRGARGYGGELAHLQLDTQGPLCACGGRGCLIGALNELTASPITHVAGERFDVRRLPELVAAGDAGAERLMFDLGRMLGRPLGQLCTYLDPDEVIVASSMPVLIAPVIEGITESFRVGIPPAVGATLPIRAAILSDTSEVAGALELVREPARRA